MSTHLDREFRFLQEGVTIDVRHWHLCGRREIESIAFETIHIVFELW